MDRQTVQETQATTHEQTDSSGEPGHHSWTDRQTDSSGVPGHSWTDRPVQENHTHGLLAHCVSSSVSLVSLLLCCLCVCIHECAGTHAYASAHVSGCMWRSEKPQVFVLEGQSPCLGQGLSLSRSLPNRLSGLTSEPQARACLYFPSRKTTSM